MTERLCVAVRYATASQEGSHPLEGTWATSRGDMEISIEGAFEGLSVSGSRGIGGGVSGIVMAEVEQRSGIVFDGFYHAHADLYVRPCVALERAVVSFWLCCVHCAPCADLMRT